MYPPLVARNASIFSLGGEVASGRYHPDTTDDLWSVGRRASDLLSDGHMSKESERDKGGAEGDDRSVAAQTVEESPVELDAHNVPEIDIDEPACKETLANLQPTLAERDRRRADTRVGEKDEALSLVRRRSIIAEGDYLTPLNLRSG